MRITSFFSALFKAFYSRSFYQDVGRKWKGFGISYLFALLALAWIPFIIMLMAAVEKIDTSTYESNAYSVEESAPKEGINAALRAIITQLPTITIKNGEASIQQPEPYKIHDPVTNRLVMVIDTQDKSNGLKNRDAFILLTKRDLYLRSASMGEIHYLVADIAGKDPLVIDQALAKEWVNNAKPLMRWILPFVFFPLMVLISLVYNAFSSLLCAFIGFGIAKILKADLRFADVFRLTVVASTPVIFFEVLSILSPPQILMPYQNFIFFGLSMGYLFFAISANQPAENPGMEKEME